MNRRQWAFFAALLISLAYILPPVSVRAEDPEPERIEITHAQIDDESPYFLRAGDSVDTLPLETRAAAYFSQFGAEYCDIEWRTLDFDNETPGRRPIVGDVILPDEYVYPDGDLTVESIVIVYDDDGAPHIRVTSCFYSDLEAPVVLPLGASASQIEEAFLSVMWDSAVCYTEDGDDFIAPVSLDLSVIDTDTPGAYYPVTVELPGGLTFGGMEFWMLAAHVVPTDEISLAAVSLGESGYNVQWVHAASEQTLWVSVDGGAFVEGGLFAETMYGYFQTVDPHGFIGLYLPYTNFESGHVYKFVVQYDNDRLSDALELDFTDGDIPKASNENGGDRTGIDRGGSNPLPDNKPPDNKPSDNKPSDSGRLTTPRTDSTGGGDTSPTVPMAMEPHAEEPENGDAHVPAEPPTELALPTDEPPPPAHSTMERPYAASSQAPPPITAELEEPLDATAALAPADPHGQSLAIEPPDARQTEDNPPRRDSAAPIAIACGMGLCGVAAYVGFSLKRRAGR